MPPRYYTTNNPLVNSALDFANQFQGLQIGDRNFYTTRYGVLPTVSSPVSLESAIGSPQSTGPVSAAGSGQHTSTPHSFMSEKDMWSSLSEPLTQYGQGAFGPSLLDQYRNAQSGLDALKGLDVTDANRRTAESILGSQKLQAGVGMGLSALQGVTGLMNSFNSLNTIADTSAQQGMVDDISALGTRDYGNYSDLSSGYDALNRQTNFDYDDIRGMNTMQKVGNVASAIGTGASAGMAFGPWGAVVGGLAGLGTGIAGWLSGDANARTEQARLQREAKQATNSAITNLNAANEALTNRQFRSGIATRAAQGGQIERQQMSIKEFADKVLKVRKANDVNRSMNIVRRKGEGGTIIRIKM